MASSPAVATLSRLLAALHAPPPDVPLATFRAHVLEQARSALPFTGAVWSYGAVTPRGAVFHDMVVIGLAPTFEQAVRATAEIDPTMSKLAGASGRSFVHSRSDYPDEILKLAGDPDGLESSIECMLVQEDVALFESVCLFRNASLPPFSEQERELHEALMPHWAYAWSRRLVACAFDAARAEPAEARAVAVSTHDGTLMAATDEFGAVLRLQYPDWPGGTLPEALRARCTAGPRSVAREAKIVTTVEVLPTMVLVHARPCGAVDTLGEREREVARLLAQGLGVKQVAAQLKLSPSTVENHRDHIYRKLDVSNRAGLIRALGSAQ